MMGNEQNQQNIAGLNLDLRTLMVDLLRGARRLWWLGVVLAVLGGALLCLHTHRTYTPRYRADASFTVHVTNPLYAGVKTYNAGTAEQMAVTFPYILTSGVLSERVMEKLELSHMPAVSASVKGNTNIFTLSVTSGDPRLAYDVLQAVIECYPDVAEFVIGPTVMTLLDESGVPSAPINTRDYAGSAKKGVLIGVAIWLALVVLLAMLRSTVHSEEELKSIMSLPCVGQLPLVRRWGKKKKSAPVLMDERDKAGFGESVRLLRIRVEKEMRQRGGKVLLVSSAIPGEGKTTVSTNLAIALASKKKKVLLVDCDLRNPSVASVLGLEEGKGLAELLKKQVNLKGAVRSGGVENLSVVCGGRPVGNAAELLSSRGVRVFVDSARDVFDYVILDTPPCSMLADAAEVASIADCALLTVRQNFAPRDQILDGVEFLSDSGLPVVGCVLNGMKRSVFDKRTSSGYYGYGRYERSRSYGGEMAED